MTNLDNANDWWGGEGRSQNRLSLLDLIGNETLSIELAALLWLFVENKTSILTAAGPQLAGKTTLLTALLDMAPRRYNSVLTQGRSEDFSFLDTTDAANTYVLVPELSDHTPAYLWGESVSTLFDALDAGYSMVATMHADSPEQVTQMLRQQPVAIPSEQLHHVGVVINIRLMYGERDMIRRVTAVTLIEPGPKFVRLAISNDADESSAFLESEQSRQAVSKRINADNLATLLAQRQAILEEWLASPPNDAASFAGRVAKFYESNPSNTSE